MFIIEYMAKKKVKAKKTQKKSSGLLKVLEAIVVVGSLAAVLIGFLKGKKGKK